VDLRPDQLRRVAGDEARPELPAPARADGDHLAVEQVEDAAVAVGVDDRDHRDLQAPQDGFELVEALGPPHVPILLQQPDGRDLVDADHPQCDDRPVDGAPDD
jgi:hypothetical protein